MQRNASPEARKARWARMLWETSCMLAQAMGGGPGVDTHTSFGEGLRRARVNRFQHFCRCRVRAPGVEGRLRRIFQAELNHLGHAWSTQLRDKCKHEIDAGRDAPPVKILPSLSMRPSMS